MVPFGLGDLADLVHEGERFLEILELERALDLARVIDEFPFRRLFPPGFRALARKRRHPAAASGAGFCGKIGHASLRSFFENTSLDGNAEAFRMVRLAGGNNPWPPVIRRPRNSFTGLPLF